MNFAQVKPYLTGSAVALIGSVLIGGMAMSHAQQTEADQAQERPAVEHQGQRLQHAGQQMPMHQELMDLLNLSDAEIATLQNDTTGKTLGDLLQEKGISKDQLKANALAKITERFNSQFDTHFEKMSQIEVAKMFGRVAEMQQKRQELLDQLGLTQEEFEAARQDGTLKDLFEEKGIEKPERPGKRMDHDEDDDKGEGFRGGRGFGQRGQGKPFGGNFQPRGQQ